MKTEIELNRANLYTDVKIFIQDWGTIVPFPKKTDVFRQNIENEYYHKVLRRYMIGNYGPRLDMMAPSWAANELRNQIKDWAAYHEVGVGIVVEAVKKTVYELMKYPTEEAGRNEQLLNEFQEDHLTELGIESTTLNKNLHRFVFDVREKQRSIYQVDYYSKRYMELLNIVKDE